MAQLYLARLDHEAQSDWQETVREPKRVGDNAPQPLREYEKVRIWGTKPTENRREQFEDLSPGDFVLFSEGRFFFYVGRVKTKFDDVGSDISQWAWNKPGRNLAFTVEERAVLRQVENEAVWEWLGYKEEYNKLPYELHKVGEKPVNDLRETYGTIEVALQNLLQRTNQDEVPGTDYLEDQATPRPEVHDGPPKAGISSNTAGVERQRTGSEVQVSESFRDTILDRYNDRCVLTDIQGSPFVTLAHVLRRTDRKDIAEHPQNVLALNWLHHKAFDAHIFTFDSELSIRVDPDFSTENRFLRETLIERDGERVVLPENATLSSEFIMERNEDISWFSE